PPEALFDSAWTARAETDVAPEVYPPRPTCRTPGSTGSSSGPWITDSPGGEGGMEGDAAIAGDQPASLQEGQGAGQLRGGEMAPGTQLLDGTASLDERPEHQSLRV